MLCYFDSDTDVNLSHLDQIKNVRPLAELKNRLFGFQFLTSQEYNSPGIYLIEVSKVPELWCAKTYHGSDNVILNIPRRVIRAARERKIRVVIISTIEGDNFTSDSFDGFKHLHDTVDLLGLPKYSVCIVSGNLNSSTQYKKWCLDNSKDELIEFLEGIEWDGKQSTPRPTTPIVIDDNAVPFNSLNRAHRSHRSEHLYYLTKNNLTGLISGGFWFDNDIDPPRYLDVNYSEYKNTLLSNYPKTVDVFDIKNDVPNLINNLDIYTSSQLTVVTESHFNQQGGLFITEKTFRPIIVGHPFIILGQAGLLDKLKTFGFITDFPGIDQSYDNVEDDSLRFKLFHQTLTSWCSLDIQERKKLIMSWKPIINFNFNNYNKLDFKKLICNSIIDTTIKYFREDF